MRRPEPGAGSSDQCGGSPLTDNITTGKSGHVMTDDGTWTFSDQVKT